MFHRKNKRQKKSQEMLDIDLMEEIGYYQKKPQKKGLDQKIVIALVLVVVVAACVLVFAVVFGEKNRGGGRKPVYDIRALRKNWSFQGG